MIVYIENKDGVVEKTTLFGIELTKEWLNDHEGNIQEINDELLSRYEKANFESRYNEKKGYIETKFIGDGTWYESTSNPHIDPWNSDAPITKIIVQAQKQYLVLIAIKGKANVKEIIEETIKNNSEEF